MRSEKKLKILTAIESGQKFSRNNRDMAILQANGYIEVKGVGPNNSYRNAEISLSAWGTAWLKVERDARESTS